MRRDYLRPLERAVLRRRDDGLGIDEIAARFGRSAGHIERIIDYTSLPRVTGGTPRSLSHLRPIERRVLRLIDEGSDYEHLGAVFKRSAGHMRRVAGLAHLRQALSLLA